MKTSKYLMMLCIAVSAIASYAAEPGPIKVLPQVRDLGEWDALKTENALLDDQIKNQELKNKLRGLTGDGGLTLQGGGSLAGSGPRQIQVQMVSGLNGHLQALLCISGAASQTVKVGSKVNGGGVIRSISVSEVTVELNRNVISIPFASENVCASNGGFETRNVPGMQTGMPAGVMNGGPR